MFKFAVKAFSRVTMQSGKLDLEYLKLHQIHLSQQQKIVVLLIDEVYTAQHNMIMELLLELLRMALQHKLFLLSWFSCLLGNTRM